MTANKTLLVRMGNRISPKMQDQESVFICTHKVWDGMGGVGGGCSITLISHSTGCISILLSGIPLFLKDQNIST